MDHAGILLLEVDPDSNAVSYVSSFTIYMTYYDPSDIYISSQIAALIIHHQRTFHTARTAKAIHLVHSPFESVYSIDHLTALITPHYTARRKLVQKFIDKNWLSAQVF